MSNEQLTKRNQLPVTLGTSCNFLSQQNVQTTGAHTNKVKMPNENKKPKNEQKNLVKLDIKPQMK